MARITRVAKAQQRYETVPVIDPETGQQKQTPVMRNGKQRLTKRGTPIFLSVTIADKSKPLPNRKCDKCREEIKVGDPYKHISPRSGPYGGRTMYRCATCPDWHVWEYSSSLSARVAEISYNFANEADSWESQDDVQESLNAAAEAVREIASEKEEGADNIESGFGHETSMSEELREVAEQLNSWADEIEGVDIPDYPEPEEEDCDDCEGSGEVENEEFLSLQSDHEEVMRKINEVKKHLLRLMQIPEHMRLHDAVTKANLEIKKLTEEGEAIEAKLEDVEATDTCETCDGSGRVEPEDPTQEQIDEWRSEVESAVSIVDECPV